MKRPVAPRDRIRVTVDDIGHAGDGVARYQDYVLFVPETAPGDEVEVEVSSVGRSFGRAEVRRLLQASPGRAVPRCQHYGDCGGCQLQHLDYDLELEHKRRWVQGAIERIGGMSDVQVDPVLSVGEPYGYRERTRFGVSSDGGGATVGFYRRGTNQLVDIERCEIQVERNNRVLGRVRSALRDCGDGVLAPVRELVIRTAGDDSLVVFTLGDRGWPEGRELSAELMRDIPEISGVVCGGDGGEYATLAGDDRLYFEFEGLRLRSSATAFTQVSEDGARILYHTVLEQAGFRQDDTVCDLFSGIGVLTAMIAREVRRVFGVDMDPAAVSDARFNALRNALGNVFHICAEASEGLCAVHRDPGRIQVVVMDPPRSGCTEELLDALSEVKPRRVVYVSCDSATWSRDVSRMVRSGWTLGRVIPVDLFPRTANVEIVSVLDAPHG